MEYAGILHRCFRCGYCKLPSNYQDINCPSYLKFRFETFAPGGRMWLLRAWQGGEIKTSARLAEILFSCAACGNCVEHCVFPKFKSDLLNAFTAGRAELVNQGAVPGQVSNYFKSLSLYGNPYRVAESERGAWAQGLGLEEYRGQDYLLYVGDAGSHDERGQKMARAVAALLAKLGVSFGILAAAERSDGNEARVMGETGLFESLAKNNLKQFAAAGVKRIIAVSPHAFHVMKNVYPLLGGSFEVSHYSQVLAQRMNRGKYNDSPGLKVTFHDPCYLGRHNRDYWSPRLVLAALPGLEGAEMDRSQADALCCGGGGGNFFTDVLGGGPDGSGRARAREAAATGAGAVVTACPKCLKMLDDAVKAEGLEDRLRVVDLAELVLERMAG